MLRKIGYIEDCKEFIDLSIFGSLKVLCKTLEQKFFFLSERVEVKLLLEVTETTEETVFMKA